MSPGETQNAAIEKIPAVHVQTELSPPEKTLVSAPIAEAKAPFLNSDEPDLGAPIGVSSYEGAPELKAIPISPTHAQNGQAENNGARESDDSESLLDGEEASLLPPRLLRKA